MSLSTNFNTVKNEIDDISFGILRTNPKLTTNIKLVVNKSGSLYLDSIDANSALASTSFKKIAVNSAGQYSNDVARFYKNLPVNLRYEIMRTDSDISVYADYSKQFEDQYHYGASFNSTKLYEEQYKFMAPIWLDKQLPSHFIIYRVEGTDYDTLLDNSLSSQNSRIMQLLNKATIVKSYDMGEQSNLGRYLRNHINNPSFPISPIIQNFEASHHTTYCGIDIVKGGLVEKKEFTNKDLILDKIEIFNNQILTEGFERNELAVANLINIEFLFDDAEATNYKVYRYFGVYVNAISEGTLEVNEVVNNDTSENLYIKANSVVSNYNLTSTGLSHSDMFINQSDLKFPSLNWVKSSLGNFFHVKNGVSFDNTKSLPVSLNGKGIEEFTSDTKIGTLKSNLFANKDAKDFIKFRLKEFPTHGDKIFLAAVSELKLEDYILNSFTYMADNTLPAGKYAESRYSMNGDLKHVLYALASCITYSENPFTAKVVGDCIVIEDYAQGYRRNATAFGIRTGNISDSIELISYSSNIVGLDNSVLPPSSPTDFTLWDIYTFTGGKAENKFIYAEKQEIGDLKVGYFFKDPVFNTKAYVLEITEDAYDSDFYRICLSAPIKNLATYNSLNYYRDPINEFGKFAAFNLKDFDFDFYDTSHSEYGELELGDLLIASSAAKTHYKYYDIACESTFNLSYDKFYPSLLSLAEGDVINRFEDAGNDFSYNAAIKIIDLKIYSEYDRLYENQLKETALLSRVIPHINKFELKDSFNARMQPYKLTFNEAFGKDNMSPNTESGLERNPVDYNMEHLHINQIPNGYKTSESYLSKLSSYVNYVSDGELTVANLKDTNKDYFTKYFVWNGAYSNISVVTEIDTTTIFNVTLIKFSKPVSPNIIISSGTTGIWKKNAVFVPLTSPNLANPKEIAVFGSIPNDVDGSPMIKVGDLVDASVSATEFIKTKDKKLYTRFDNGDQSKFANTIFRGLRYTYKSRKENQKVVPNEFIYDNLANGYKFASILNLSNDNSKTGYTIDVIKNDAHKFICVYIDLSLQKNNVNELSYKILYELRHSYNKNALTNTQVNGALDINTAYSNYTGTVTDFTEIVIDGFDDILGSSPDFERQITVIEKGSYSYLLFDYTGQTYAFVVSKVLSSSSIAVLGYPRIWDSVNQTVGAAAPGIASIAPYDQVNLTYTYFGGGWDAFKETLNELKAKSLLETFNDFTRPVKYINIKEDGTEVINNFALELDNGTPFYKQSLIKAAVDEDKPKSYKISSIEVGKKIVAKDEGYTIVLRRHNGYYVPSTKNVIYFTDLYTNYKALVSGAPVTRERLIYERFNNTGIAFASYFTSSTENRYGILKNFFYHKVNPEAPDSTLKLSAATDKLPVYPKIGEIAIDKKDLNILQSKYAEEYYVKAAPNNVSSLVPGTLNPIEEKSFLASTVMKVADIYDISAYTSIKLNSLDELNSYREKASDYSIAWTETEDKLYADFYIKRAVLDELLEKGIKSTFDKYVSAAKSFGDLSTTLDDLKVYSEWNIVNRFIINNVFIYAREGKNLTTSFISEKDPMNINQDIYRPQTNYTIEGFVQDRLSFRVIYNKKPSYNYEFKVVVKIIA